jgi:hypothetical protein
MLAGLFGFSKKNKEIFMHRVRLILTESLGINVDYRTNTYFPNYFVYMDWIEKYFYNKKSPERCAIALGMTYWETILEQGNQTKFEEAKTLKPKLVSIIDSFDNAGLISPEDTSRFNSLISAISEDYANKNKQNETVAHPASVAHEDKKKPKVSKSFTLKARCKRCMEMANADSYYGPAGNFICENCRP